MEKATFTLATYKFDKVLINIENRANSDLNIHLSPSGKFDEAEKIFFLSFVFKAYNDDIEKLFILINCVSEFKFENVETKKDIPSYFYKNSIAIIFPYIRAFISTVTLQANIKPLVLPTFNLSSLSEPLENNTILK